MPYVNRVIRTCPSVSPIVVMVHVEHDVLPDVDKRRAVWVATDPVSRSSGLRFIFWIARLRPVPVVFLLRCTLAIAGLYGDIGVCRSNSKPVY